MSTIVADASDLGAFERMKPVDCTASPTIVLKAIEDDAYNDVDAEALSWGRERNCDPMRVAAATADRLVIYVSVELLRRDPGYVSTEVGANISFNVAASSAKARRIIADHEQCGIQRDRVLIKLAATREGTRAAEILQREGVVCKMTLLFNRPQAIANADAGAFLISPFVGRIHDWHRKVEGTDFCAEEDPGVATVRKTYNHFKTEGIHTIVMGASFRNIGHIRALAGCDRLTIAPSLLDALESSNDELQRVLSPGAVPQKPLRDPTNAICHWFVSEAAVNIRRPAPSDPTDEVTFRWIMNEDAMASEKLAEGIRTFAMDLQELRHQVGRPLRLPPRGTSGEDLSKGSSQDGNT
jgi:transaldolase